MLFMLSPLIKILKEKAFPFNNPYRKENPSWNPLGRARKKIMPVDRIISYMRPHESFNENQRTWNADDLKIWMGILKSHEVLSRGTKKFLGEDFFSIPPTNSEFQNLFVDLQQFEDALSLNLDWYQNSVMDKNKKTIEYPIKVFKKHGPGSLLERPKLILGTIHSVKGGEADTVIIFPDISVNGFRLSVRSKKESDNLIRLFYVACTRAKEKLILCSASTKFNFSW